ncbi:MAG: hypothetical protein ACFFCQ_15415, partial [Promethearchaeota archaeon]
LPSDSKIKHFFPTSVFTESIFAAFGKILADLSGSSRTVPYLINDFIDRNSGLVSGAKLTDTGMTLFETPNFTHISVDQIKKLHDMLINYLANTERNTRAALLEAEEEIFVVHFLENNLTLLLSLLRKGLEEANESVSTIYNKVSSLCSQITAILS